MNTDEQKLYHLSKPTTWVKKLLVGFISVYFFLFTAPFLLEYLPSNGYFAERHAALWTPVITWIGRHVFHFDRAITISSSGDTGDAIWNYLHVFCLATVSLCISLLILIIERGRLDYSKLFDWASRFIRYALALAMISYGMVKVIKSQFYYPSLETLVHPLGDTSPARLLWAFMGISGAYNFFAGFGEALSGFLLFFRRTALLGTFLCIGVMSNVVMLNYSYDIAVKIYSIHLLMMAIFLVVPDAHRLLGFFLLNRQVQPAKNAPPFHRKGLNQTTLVLKVAVLLLFTVWQGWASFDSWRQENNLESRSALRGIWNVEEFSVDSKNPATDGTHWRKVVFDYPERGVIQMMDDTFFRVGVELDASKGALHLAGKDNADWKAELTYERPSPDSLAITGSLNNQSFHAKLRRIEDAKYSRIFIGTHWTHEKSSFSH